MPRPEVKGKLKLPKRPKITTLIKRFPELREVTEKTHKLMRTRFRLK